MNEWISVKDRLPSEAGFYLAVVDSIGVIEKVEFDGVSRWNIYWGAPTHWMPLPEPPDE